MALRLVNTAPGIITDPIKPGQNLAMSLKSETLGVQLASAQISVGLSSFMNGGVYPENDSNLTSIGVQTSFETSERRRPITGTVTKALVGSSLVLTRTSSNLGDQGIYELSLPIKPADSILGYFKFRKKSAWTTSSPDWLNLTNVIGMYFGVEHGTFNTAAYAFLRNDGSHGSIVLGGPLPGYSLPRPGQTEIPIDLDPSTVGTQGWLDLADDDVLELFIFFNTYTNPYRVELWTRIASVAYPVSQGSVLLNNLSTFPDTTFTNGRTGPSNRCSIFFGNLGQTGDILQLDDWALFPDYRPILINGEAPPGASRIVKPDAPITFDCLDKVLPAELQSSRWFPVTTGQTPNPTFFYQAGLYSKPAYLSMPKTGTGVMLYKREEPRLEQRVDGFMLEAFVAAASTDRIGDLVGAGFVVEDGQTSFKLLTLDESLVKNYGIASADVNVTSYSNYYTPSSETDFRSLKLISMILDRHRSKLYLMVDGEKALTLPINAVASTSGTQTFPTTSLTGTILEVDYSTDGGTTWMPGNHTFAGELATINALVTELNSDAGFTLGGLIVASNSGDTLTISSTAGGPLIGIQVNVASTAIGAGKLNLTTGSYLGSTTTLPASSDSVGKVEFGFPYDQLFTAELRLKSLNYLPRFLSWDAEDAQTPDATVQPAAIRFTLTESGAGTTAINNTELTITKADYISSSTNRYYKLDQTFPDVGSILVDFSAYVVAYTDENGQVGAPRTAIDAGLNLFLGNKRLSFGFFNCGLDGLRIGVTPGSGSVDDILSQTTLGKAFSAEVDWTQSNKYRIVVKSFESIQIWSGTVTEDPILEIPWRNDTDGFDLPTDVTTAGIAFGHFNILASPSSSITKWQYVRWGQSNGYELGLSQQYPNGLQSYLFGGKAFILSTFDEA